MRIFKTSAFGIALLMSALAFAAYVGSGYVFGGVQPSDQQDGDVIDVLNSFDLTSMRPGDFIFIVNNDLQLWARYDYLSGSGLVFTTDGSGGDAGNGGSGDPANPGGNNGGGYGGNGNSGGAGGGWTYMCYQGDSRIPCADP